MSAITLSRPTSTIPPYWTCAQNKISGSVVLAMLSAWHTDQKTTAAISRLNV